MEPSCVLQGDMRHKAAQRRAALRLMFDVAWGFHAVPGSAEGHGVKETNPDNSVASIRLRGDALSGACSSLRLSPLG
jgi:hypothetical protein